MQKIPSSASYVYYTEYFATAFNYHVTDTSSIRNHSVSVSDQNRKVNKSN